MLITPPAPENAANAPIRNQSMPAGTGLKLPVAASNPTQPTSPPIQVAPGTKRMASTSSPPMIRVTSTQLSISRVRSIRRPTSRAPTQRAYPVSPARYTRLASPGPASRLVNRKKTAPAAVPPQAGPPAPPAGLQQEEQGVEPGPESGPGRGPHEPGEDRLPGGDGIPHQLG